MQKVIDFLERYVEWVALAIGGVFLLAMVFAYVIGTPISAQLGGRTVTLANVESVIRDDATQRLEQEMSDTAIPTATIEPYAAKFQSYMNMKDVPLPQPIAGVWTSPAGAPAEKLKEEGSKTPQQADESKVRGLPVDLPAPKFYGTSLGRSNVLTDPGAQAPAVGFGPMGMGMPMGAYPGVPGMGYQPGEGPMAGPPGGVTGLPPAIAGGAGAAAAAKEKEPKGVDKVWATMAFTIPTDEIVASFQNAKVPATLTTMFLRVDVIRQELQPDGSWSNETQIPPLAYHQVPPFPKAGDVLGERNYHDWASKNALTILAPSFYPKVAGDTWYAPGQSNPNKAVEAKPVVNPLPVPTVPRGPRTRGGARGGGMQGPMGGPGGAPGGGTGSRQRGRSYAPQDDQRPNVPFLQFGPPGMSPEQQRAMQQAVQQGQQMAQQAARAAGRQGAAPPPEAAGTYPGMPDVSGSFGRAQVSVPEGYKVPSGTFNPAELEADIFGWFHDDTVQPGKTYRYKVSYKIRNPLYGNPNLAADPQLAKTFAIASPFSEWSEAVVIEPTTRFFVASGVATGATTVRIDVFRWQDGEWHTKQFTVAPGDMIGANDGKINYETGWSLADLDTGTMSREPVIVTDSQGKLDSRSFQGDQSGSGLFKKEIDWKDPNAVPKNPAGLVPGMSPGMGGPPPGWNPPPGWTPPGVPAGPGGRRGGN